MHKSATKCNKTLGKWCKNKHEASKIMDTLETYHLPMGVMKLSEFSFAFFASVFMDKYHRVRAQRSRWE
jgi:hypothetical protein